MRRECLTMPVNEKQQKPMPDALPAGYRFNEFEIKDVIGGGGFGIVYRAWDHLLERTIAIKEYMPGSMAIRHKDLSLGLRSERHRRLFTAGLNSFIQEARLLAQFNHPSLLHVLRFWEENGTAYMGTLYYSGITLKKWQQLTPENINEAWINQLLPPLFGAIDTIHHAGYLHRDIALDNIQIQDNQLPVLLDFGSARKEIGNLSDKTEIMLKPGFAPLEQYSEESDNGQGPWTDIYALGAVLHTLITGTPPPVSVVRCIEDRYQSLAQLRPDGYSLALLHAVDCALSMKVEDRPQSIDEFATLINLPISKVQELVSTSHLSTSTAGDSVLPLSASDTPETSESTPLTPSAPPGQRASRISRPWLMSLSATFIALLIIIAIATRYTRLFETQKKSALTQKTQTDNAHQHPAVSATLSPVPVQAKIYIRLQAGDTLRINGDVIKATPNDNGYSSLLLTNGEYKIEINKQNYVYTQQLTIEQSGTWLINPTN